MADAMMMFLGEAHGVNWYWAQPGEFENPGAYYWDGAKNVLCVPHLSAPEAPAQAVMPAPWREFVAEVVASAESYERRTGQKVNAEWVKRGKELLAAAPEAPAQASAVDERAAFEAWLGIKPCGAAHEFGWAAWQARAALAQKGGK